MTTSLKKILTTKMSKQNIIDLLGNPTRTWVHQRPSFYYIEEEYLEYELDYMQIEDAFDCAFFVVALGPDGKFRHSYIHTN